MRSWIFAALAVLLFLAGCQSAPVAQTPETTLPPEMPQTQTTPAPSAPLQTTEAADTTPQPTEPAETAPPRNTALRLEQTFPNISFTRPVEFRTDGTGASRLFVVEKAGKILVFPNENSASASVFLDLTAVVDSSASEKGLLGLAFHPDFAQNGIFFVNYTGHSATIVARYQVSSDNPNQADPSSGQTVLSFSQPYNNHNGGQIAFGPDGYLYIASGDGGSAGDPQNNAQNRTNLLGKILRIDIDNPAEGKAYGIPGDNPFAGNTYGFREEIFAYGLRNPWKFSFDDRRGWLWAADVGQDRREEINLIENGGNYGWNKMEGSLGYPDTSKTVPEFSLPIWEYAHPAGNSITGGYVYYGASLPFLHGAYIFGDFGTGVIWALWPDADKPDVRVLLDSDLLISSFGVDENNELYVVDYRGGIYRLTPQE